MLVYGNELTQIEGTVVRSTKFSATIKFNTNHKQLYVPLRYIVNVNCEERGKQLIKLQSWFLRKNRIIPLTERRIFE